MYEKIIVNGVEYTNVSDEELQEILSRMVGC